MRYRLAAGLEIVPLGEERFQLRSDFVAFELSGETAAELVGSVLSKLDRPLSFDDILERMPGYRAESLQSQLAVLVDQGVLVVSAGAGPSFNPTFNSLLQELGLDPEATREGLAGLRVGIFGLEAHGAHLAQALADAGVGTLRLVDPFRFAAAHLSLTPVRETSAIGMSREDAVGRWLSRPSLTVETSGQGPLDRARVSALFADCQLVVSCWDRGFAAAHHWANEAALEHGVPTLFSELRATSSFAGPFFLPHRSACWMCYRMRSLAAEKDFDLAMAYEEHLDRKRQPSLAERPIMPMLPLQLASVLGQEALKYLIRLNQPALVDRVLELDALASETSTHPVLVMPFCTTCGKKKSRVHPGAAELSSAVSTAGSLPEVAHQLVSPRTGIVCELAAAPRDATEPAFPLVWRARLSNHCFLSEPDDSHRSCSGKGMTREEAWTSSLGEAVERYSGGVWDPEEIRVARRADLDGPSLDPRDLVLYLPEQYAQLPYAPYSEATELGWVRGRSLISSEHVWLPALAVFMEYQTKSQEEFLFPITSNGLAAGPTLGDAILSAIYEVIERDAFLITWLNRLPCRRFKAVEHPDQDVRRLALAYARRGVRLALFQLPADHPVAVFLGIAFQEGGFGGPFATIGLGADLDPLAAARSAVLEVGQVRPAFRERARGSDAPRIAELAARPSSVKSLEDHALLYADPSMAGAFAFLAGDEAEWPRGSAQGRFSALTQILEHFRATGQDVLYFNLTSRDLEPLGLFTARAILPGYQPIWFGRAERRLGGARLFDLPARLGLTDERLSPESLNPLPHPLA